MLRIRKRRFAICVLIILSSLLLILFKACPKEVEIITVVNPVNEQLEYDNYILSQELQRRKEETQELQRTISALQDELQVFKAPVDIQAEHATYYTALPLEQDLQDYTYLICVDYGIPEHYELILAMMWQETHFRPDVISSTNDYGIMQINTVNHDWLEETIGVTNFLDPEQNIQAGTYMIARLLNKYGDEQKSLMAYNFGERGAKRLWDAGIYTSGYSREVIAKQELIYDNIYE